jgi:hypothetical protein
MYNIYSFDSEYLKLHNNNGTQSYYERKYNIVEINSSILYLLRLRRKKYVFSWIKFGRNLF